MTQKCSRYWKNLSVQRRPCGWCPHASNTLDRGERKSKDAGVCERHILWGMRYFVSILISPPVKHNLRRLCALHDYFSICGAHRFSCFMCGVRDDVVCIPVEGYYAKLKAFATQIRKAYDKKLVKITASSTEKPTGYFEVSVAGKLVHSKKAGDGFASSTQQIEKIFKAIEDAIAEKTKTQTQSKTEISECKAVHSK
eukprot:713675-Amorphochlora_amoeboformis.AAC.1